MTCVMAPRGKTVRSTSAQLKLLVDYMSTNPIFAAGQFTGPLGAQKLNAEWTRLQQMLAEVGPAKSVDQWKHTWRDLKKKSRDEAARTRMAQNKTGNVHPIPVLNDNSQKILGIIGEECALGIAVEQETGIGDGILQPAATASTSHAEEHTSTSTDAGRVVSAATSSRVAVRGRRRVVPSNRTGDIQRYLAALNNIDTHVQELVAEMRVSNMLQARSRRRRPSPLDRLKF